MGRNLDRRVELMFPVEDPPLLQEILSEALESALRDNASARELGTEGRYVRLSPPPGEPPFESQREIIRARLSRHRVQRAVPRDAP
jgi:polyphosphate kinase